MSISVVLSVMCLILGGILLRVLFVFHRERECLFEDQKFLEEAFRQAGWSEQLQAARQAAHGVRTGHQNWSDWQATARRIKQGE